MKLFIVQILNVVAIVSLLSACTNDKEIEEVQPPQIARFLGCHDANNSYGIVNGTSVPAQSSDSKRAVLLIIKKGEKISSCTGVPISDRVILTAAHCVKGAEKTGITVIFHPEMTCASGYDISKTIASSDTIVHKDYDASAKATADLALVKLASPIPSEYPIETLYDGKSDLSSDKVLMLGYGITQESLSNALHLRKTFKSYQSDTLVKDQNIVFDQSNATGGVCSGDSGGPIYVESNGQYKIIGVNSVVEGTRGPANACHEISRAMYAPYFAEWIQSNLLKLQN